LLIREIRIETFDYHPKIAIIVEVPQTHPSFLVTVPEIHGSIGKDSFRHHMRVRMLTGEVS